MYVYMCAWLCIYAHQVPGGVEEFASTQLGSGARGDGAVKRPADAMRDFDIVVSNPPYIPQPDMETLQMEVIGFEDYGALCGGPDGLDVVKQVLEASPNLLREDGPREIWLEVDPSHPTMLQKWLSESRPELGLELLNTYHDLGGHARFCELRWCGVKR